jgi:hypothetical protein
MKSPRTSLRLPARTLNPAYFAFDLPGFGRLLFRRMPVSETNPKGPGAEPVERVYCAWLPAGLRNHPCPADSVFRSLDVLFTFHVKCKVVTWHNQPEFRALPRLEISLRSGSARFDNPPEVVFSGDEVPNSVGFTSNLQGGLRKAVEYCYTAAALRLPPKNPRPFDCTAPNTAGRPDVSRVFGYDARLQADVELALRCFGGWRSLVNS